MRRLLACWALLVLLMGSATPILPPVYMGDVSAAYAHALRGVDFTITWRRCGYVNAYYNPDTHRVTLCTELGEIDPGAARAIFVHELGHALIDQLHVPVTGLEEAAADEFAAWFFIRNGWNADLLALADLFGTDPTDDPRDEHPSNARRRISLLCLEGQSRGEYLDAPACRQTSYERANRVWSKYLAR